MEHLVENQPIERNNNNNIINNINNNNNNINQIGENNNNQNIENNVNNNINNNNNAMPPPNPQNNNQNNNGERGGGFNFGNFNLNNLNYNRFRHVLHTHELEFLLNQKYSKSLWEIICTLTFTKMCHKISFFLLAIFFFCIFYIFIIMNYKNSSIILKLESEDSYFEIIIWMIAIIIIIISWNLHMLLFCSIFKYDYSKTANNIRTSFVEEFYKNPIGFILLLFYIDTSNLKNSIDDSFWVLVEVLYFILFYNLNQYFTQFYKELNTITDFKEKTNTIKKVNFISLLFIFEGTILDIKEKIFFQNFRTKSFLELGGMIYVFIQISSCFIMGDSTPFYFNVVICYFIFILGFHILTYFKKYKEITGYLKGLESCLEIAEIQDDKECVICTEKMTHCRKLNCNHYFHLICLSKWFENGHNSCPICRTEINFSEKVKNIIRNRINMGNNNENNEQNTNSIFPFNINYNLFSWLPNNSLRIIRFINNNENNNEARNNVNIIVNNPNINRININIRRINNQNNQGVQGQNQNQNQNQNN